MAANVTPAAKSVDDPDTASIYRTSLVTLMRAHDTYGVWEKKSDEEILQGFVLTKEQRRAIPIIGEPDAKVLWRLEVFYTAVSYAVTRRSGLDATPIIKLSGEGFGRVVITVGRLVVLSRAVRDVHRFGFDSTNALTLAGGTMVAESLDAIERFPAVASATE
jgi:probable nitrogen fixation protein